MSEPMTIEEIMAALEVDALVFQREAVEQAIARQAEIAPHLLNLLERALASPEIFAERDTYSGHLYAMYLLAQFRETRAYPLVAQICRLPSDTVGKLIGDTITEGLSNILASVFDGDTTPIEGIVEDANADEFVRGAGIATLENLYFVNRISRDYLVSYLDALIRGKLERGFIFTWNNLAETACNIGALELKDDLREIFDAGLLDESYSRWSELEKDLQRSPATVNNSRYRAGSELIDDVIAEMENWACFTEPHVHSTGCSCGHPHPSHDQEAALNLYRDFAGDNAPLPTPASRPSLVGRNDPCPCGSGKKYKKCCGQFS